MINVIRNAEVIRFDDFRNMERRKKAFCQEWHDTDQSAGFTLHPDLESWMEYKNKRIEETKGNHYPFRAMSDPVKILVSENIYDRMRKKGTLVFGYDYGGDIGKMIGEGHILEVIG